MVRKLAALMALIMIFAMCGIAEEADVTPEPVPVLDVTAEPSEGPTAEPTVEVTEEPTQEPTADPTVEPTEEPTEEPTLEPTNEPTQEATIEPTAAPTVDPASEAWMNAGDGEFVWGTAADMIAGWQAGEIIYVLADRPVVVVDIALADVENIVFMPDPDKFGEDYRCVLSEDAPTDCVPPEDVENYIYIWVEEIPEETPEPTEKPTPAPTATPVPEMEIRVAADNYLPGQWSGEKVTFTLSGIPENAERFSYAVIAYDERFIILSGNTYTCDDEGESDLRFVILDGIGDVAARSQKYEPMLDLTPPSSIYVQMKEGSYKKYFVSAEDALSGVAEFSSDGGETWVKPNEDGMAAFKGKSGDVIPAGMILAKDNAGNISAYEMDFYIPEKTPSWDGGGSGGGGNEDETPHAPPAGEADLNPYNALELEISEKPMKNLIMGETELPLFVELDFAGEFEIPEDYEQLFTARLEKWGPEEEITQGEEGKFDTLVITPVHDENIADEYAYMFHFNGVVYRMLMNSGIDYLVFETGDGICAISTAGFTAGTEYTRMKSEGVSTKYMDYTVRLMGDGDMETPVEMVMEMEVTMPGSEEIYPLVDEITCGDGTMYYYDVQFGPAEMMEVPFGAWIMDGTHMDDMMVAP